MIPPPPHPDFGWLAALSYEDLWTAAADAGAYQNLLESALQRSHPSRAAQEQRQRNAELARENLARRDECREALQALTVVRTSDHGPAAAAYEGARARQEDVLQRLAPQVLMERLRRAAGEADAASEDLVERCRGGELGMDEFVESYLVERTLFHLRDLKHQAAVQTIPPHA